MALAQLVVAICLLALSLGNKDTKAGFTNDSVSKKPTLQNDAGQQGVQSKEQRNRFARWAFNSPTEEFSAIPFAPDEEQENVHRPSELFVRRSPEMLLAPPPPLDKVGGGFFARELSEPELFEGFDPLRGEAFGISGRYALQREILPSHNALRDIRRKRSDTQAMPIKRFDKIGRTGFKPANSGGSFISSKKNSGSGFTSYQKKYLDETDGPDFGNQKKRNFDEIDRAGFRSFGKRNFDEIDRAGFRNFRRRNFDEIDKSGFRDFGKRDFDEIDRSGFRNFGKRNFDEIDRSGFRSFGKRSPEQSDIKGSFGQSSRDLVETYNDENNELRKRNFDEIDRSGFRSFSKRSTGDEKSEISLEN